MSCFSSSAFEEASSANMDGSKSEGRGYKDIFIARIICRIRCALLLRSTRPNRLAIDVPQGQLDLGTEKVRDTVNTRDI